MIMMIMAAVRFYDSVDIIRGDVLVHDMMCSSPIMLVLGIRVSMSSINY